LWRKLIPVRRGPALGRRRLHMYLASSCDGKKPPKRFHPERERRTSPTRVTFSAFVRSALRPVAIPFARDDMAECATTHNAMNYSVCCQRHDDRANFFAPIVWTHTRIKKTGRKINSPPGLSLDCGSGASGTVNQAKGVSASFFSLIFS